ncbi:MAG: aldo/keto reductase [Clostridia bacterium]|nr:aldo/keto reductase [Clostridia bacterium]
MRIYINQRKDTPMQYRPFGNTGVNLSSLGIGGMRFPYVPDTETLDFEKGVEIIRRAFELGVNYIDTAPYYMHDQSQKLFGMALKGWRDRVYVSTKCGHNIAKPDTIRLGVEQSCETMGIDHIDFYHMWGMDWKAYEEKMGPESIAMLEKLKAEGLIRHISFSFHGPPDDMKKLCDTGIFESVLCQYNIVDRGNEGAIKYCRAKGMGTAIMGPLAGGRLGPTAQKAAQMIDEKGPSFAQRGLRFVLSNPDVCCAVSGMGSIADVEENAATASDVQTISEAEREEIYNTFYHHHALAGLYCTGCDYCRPCPAGVNIKGVFDAYNLFRVHREEQNARDACAKIADNGTICTDCAVCEGKCPQKLEVRRFLKEAHEFFVPQPKQTTKEGETV